MAVVVVPYTQRRVLEHGGGYNGGDGSVSNSGGTTLHHLLFNAIAGDSATERRGNAHRHPGFRVEEHCVSQPHHSFEPLLVLRGLRFGMLDEATVAELAVATITNPSCGEAPGSLSDQRMGASANHTGPCQTCRQQHHNCPGHFGRIALPYPMSGSVYPLVGVIRAGPAVINPLFVSLLVSVLQSCCLNCHRLRISPYYIQTMINPRARPLPRLKSVSMLCIRQPYCQFCNRAVCCFFFLVPNSEQQMPVGPVHLPSH